MPIKDADRQNFVKEIEIEHLYRHKVFLSKYPKKGDKINSPTTKTVGKVNETTYLF